MSASDELIRRRRAVVPQGVGMFAGDTTVASACGSKLIDLDGREILDFASGIGVMNVGHCEPTVVKAIQEQAAKLLHVCIHIGTYEPYIELCEKLCEILPHGVATKAMLQNSGAEAVENAVKIARQATRRPAILCYSGSFHGRTLLGMTLTAKSAYKRHCGPFAPEVYRLPYPDHFHYGDGLLLDAFVKRELVRVERAFTAGPIPAEHVAAVIIEPILGEGGFVPAPFEYMQGLRALCDKFGIVMIVDEVQSGFGRTGKWGAFEHSGIIPDLSVWAKSMGGGLPLSAIIGRAEIMDAAEPGTLGGTYGGNPVACAASLATIAVIDEKNLCARADEVGGTIRNRFLELAKKCDLVADVRGIGAMIAVELCEGGDPNEPATDVALQAVALCLERGVLVLKAGPFANVLRILTPLVISDAELDRGLDIIESAILDAAARRPS